LNLVMRLNRAALGWLLVASSLRVSALLPSCRELGGAARASQRGRAEALASAFEVAGRRSIETPAAADAWRARFPALGRGVFELQQQAVEAGLKLSAPQVGLARVQSPVAVLSNDAYARA
jgi:hypothetical protein